MSEQVREREREKEKHKETRSNVRNKKRKSKQVRRKSMSKSVHWKENMLMSQENEKKKVLTCSTACVTRSSTSDSTGEKYVCHIHTTDLCPFHVPDVLPLKVQMFTNHFPAVRVRHSCVKVKEGQHTSNVNDRQATVKTETMKQ